MWRSGLMVLLMTGAIGSGVWAAQEAVTDDGMRVLLYDDGTWERVDPQPRVDEDAEPVRLEVEKREALPNACRFGLRLSNNLKEPIRSLVLRFTAYKPGPIAYETVTRGFFNIKPTDSQYQTILFRGLTCDGILKVEVSAADKCRVGEFSSYWYGADRCIGGVDVVESELVRIYK